MEKLSYFIGLDTGTTSTKAIVYSSSGEIKGIGNVLYPLIVSQPSRAEQNPEVIFEAVIQALKEAVKKSGVEKKQIAAIGYSTAMHSLIAVDALGKPLTNSITWADGRSDRQTERLKKDGIGYGIYLRTGTPIHPMSPLTKLIWMKEEDPGTFNKAAKFLSIKEYVLYKLFGAYVVDYSIASATGLFHLKNLDWDEDALKLAGIQRGQLSEPVPTTHILKGLKIEFAEEIGLDPNIPFVVGASDGVLANLGVGAINKGQTAVTIGTSGAVRTVVDQPLTDSKGRTFCYVLSDDKWVIGGSTNNGGMVLRWFRDEFGAVEAERAEQLGVDIYEAMIDAASTISAGAEGLLFMPYLSGERAPYWSANTKGSFFGIGLHHKREHFIRAVLEGILFSVYHVELALRELTGQAREIRATGGFARSSIWRQILSDMFGYAVLVPESHESSSFGAALLAMVATGRIRNFADADQFIRITHQHQPNLTNTEIYHQLFPVFESFYLNNKQQLEYLTQFQRNRYKKEN